MCTVSWVREASGYQLFCNRDEKHTRKQALLPRIVELRGVRFIAPMDGDSGGTWIGVNQFRLSLCLLNRYHSQTTEPEKQLVSRGLLVRELMDCVSQSDVQQRLGGMRLTDFKPFTLLALEPAAPACVFHWTGQELLMADDGESLMPLISSSFDADGVVAFRQPHFARMKDATGEVSPEMLEAFHRSHDPAPGAYSPCMHRADAQTVSFSRIKVAGSVIEFSYNPQALCYSTKSLQTELTTGRNGEHRKQSDWVCPQLIVEQSEEINEIPGTVFGVPTSVGVFVFGKQNPTEVGTPNTVLRAV